MTTFTRMPAQSDGGRIIKLQTSLDLTGRGLACPGETIAFSCVSNGSGLNWDSDPPLGSNGEKNIHTFTQADTEGNSSCYLVDYTNGTSFFVATVLEFINSTSGQTPNHNLCNSSLILTPVANEHGLLPTGTINVSCITQTNSGSDDVKFKLYQLAGNAMINLLLVTCVCTYSHT